MDFFWKSSFLLSLLLLAFILKGLVFVSILPMHQGSDEYIHYATMQYLAEPKEKEWERNIEQRKETDTKEIVHFHYTEEIRAFARLTESRAFSGAPHNTQNFSPEKISSVEEEMKSGKYPPHIAFTSPDIVGGGNLAHRVGSWVERALSEKDVFTRYAVARSIAIFYGIIVVLCAYFIALWSGLRREHSLLIAGLVAFQPQFSATTAIINYDPLLIAAYSVVLLGAVSVLRHSINIWNTAAMIVFSLVAMEAKGIGGILLFFTVGVILWGLRERYESLKKISLWKIGISAIALFGLVFLLAPQEYTSILTNIPAESRGKTIWKSLASYLDGGVFDTGKVERTAVTYWGTFGWLDTQLHGSVMDVIQTVEYIAAFGFILLVLFLSRSTALFQNTKQLLLKIAKACPLNRFTKFISHSLSVIFSVIPVRQSSDKRPAGIQGLGFRIPSMLRIGKFGITKMWNVVWSEKNFLPERKYLVLFLASIILLQIAIRFYDWYGRYMYGEGVGTPGRYFLPNIIPHMILLATGLGMFVRTSRAFGIILKTLFAGMVILSLYAIFWVIIPRYYL